MQQVVSFCGLSGSRDGGLQKQRALAVLTWWPDRRQPVYWPARCRLPPCATAVKSAETDIQTRFQKARAGAGATADQIALAAGADASARSYCASGRMALMWQA
jgi:hypothetical protein